QTEILEKPVNNLDLSVHILTCHWDFKMFFWSLVSYYKIFNIIGKLYIHNDGTLNSKEINLIKQKFPSAVIIDARDFNEKYADKLEKYPVFKKIRLKHFNFFSFKKIIDPYLASDKKMCLIFDTDMLWFKNPAEIENAIKNNCENLSYMQRNNKYKDKEINKKLTDYNAGIILYARENFNVKILSDYFESLDENNRDDLHFADQTGHVKCLKKLKALPEDKYIIRGKVDENIVAKHYTAPRRVLFYTEGINKLKNKLLQNAQYK
ncbi:MAG: hypothetical protein ABIF17_05275, partial [Patescibacteria group bacterium]